MVVLHATCSTLAADCQIGLKNGAHSRYAYQPAAFIIAAPVGALAATRDREVGVQQQQEQRPE